MFRTNKDSEKMVPSRLSSPAGVKQPPKRTKTQHMQVSNASQQVGAVCACGDSRSNSTVVSIRAQSETSLPSVSLAGRRLRKTRVPKNPFTPAPHLSPFHQSLRREGAMVLAAIAAKSKERNDDVTTMTTRVSTAPPAKPLPHESAAARGQAVYPVRSSFRGAVLGCLLLLRLACRSDRRSRTCTQGTMLDSLQAADARSAHATFSGLTQVRLPKYMWNILTGTCTRSWPACS
eukprot:TRINITY_DN21444_c0_g1_i1.p1 TRINITY_DN21444_c0_g1~~TRINITY_DN21444_c0_g1_i1.p1  ORF type:complete len:233 (-),score=28.72 TRINITY_DN21444_c0_g1_i1:612-1310(-)